MPTRVKLIYLGLVLALCPMLAKALLPAISFPYWDSDPLTTEPIAAGLTPLWSVAYDVLSMLGAAVLLAAGGGVPRRRLASVLLFAVGAVPVVVHVASTHEGMDEARIGLSWLSAMAAGVGVCCACGVRGVGVQRVVLSVFAGLVGVMVLKGAVQLLIEHPAVVESYRQNREQILTAQGWSPDSAMARGYERRLMQAEATGWFGLSNVYASVAAAMAAAWLVLAVAALRARAEAGRWGVGAAAGGLLASVACVAMANGKGGWLVMLIGLATGAGLLWLQGSRWHGLQQSVRRSLPLALPAACVAAILVVLVRGMVGDRFGELSLLFRSYYFEAAWRVFVDSALGRPNPAGADLPAVTGFFGTGAAGFKEAYIVYKNPFSPEDVASVHSVFLDWMATLGVLGWGWCGLLVWWLVDAGRGFAAEQRQEAGGDTGDETEVGVLGRVVCAIVIGATLLSLPHAMTVMTGEELLSRMGGMLLWCVLSAGAVQVLAVARAADLRFAMFCSALVLVVHGQIEQTFAWSSSVGLIVMLVSAAGAGSPAERGETGRRGSRVAFGLLAIAAVSVAGGVLVMRVQSWEAMLERTAQSVWNARDAGGQARFTTIVRAAGELAAVSDWPTRREASRMLATAGRMGAPPALSLPALDLADQVVRAPAPVGSDVRSAIEALAGGKPRAVARAAVAANTLDINQNAWLGLIWSSVGDEPGTRASLERAAQYLEVAHRQDPSAPVHPLRLMEIYSRLGDLTNAARAANEAIRLDGFQKNDRLTRGLTDSQRAEAERLRAAGGTKPGG